MLNTLRGRLQQLLAADEPAFVVIEFILISLAINWCVGKLEGTRGTRPLRRLLVVLLTVTLAVRVMTVNFGWARLGVLYLFFVFAVAFIALAAFQPEIRRAFIRVGDFKLPARATSQARLINALVKAAGDLSRKKHGAVIAIRRGVDLRGWAENGTLINAEVSSNLLSTIFYPNSPLHDLGVIIQEGKVLAANCQFPSAEADEVGAALGSRHLAAIGMSYESDALVLVVSEETGTISLADNGKLTRYLSLDDLERELEERLAGVVHPTSDGEKSKASPFWYVVRRVAVVLPLTVVIWYLADQATQVERDNIQVVLRPTAPVGQIAEVIAPPLARFTVRLRGSNRSFERLFNDAAGDAVELKWQMRTLTPGDVDLETDSILSQIAQLRDLGLTVRDVRPDKIRVHIDDLVTRTLPVAIDSGEFRVAEKSLITPPTVDVTAPQAVWNSLGEDTPVVRAKVADLLKDIPAGEDRVFNEVPLQLTSESNANVKISPATASVQLRIEGRAREMTVNDVRVRLVFKPELWRRLEREHRRLELVDLVEWTIPELKLRVEEGAGALLDKQGVSASVEIPETLFEGPQVEEITLDVQVALPPGVTLVGPKPQVRIRLVDTAEAVR